MVSGPTFGRYPSTFRRKFWNVNSSAKADYFRNARLIHRRPDFRDLRFDPIAFSVSIAETPLDRLRSLKHSSVAYTGDYPDDRKPKLEINPDHLNRKVSTVHCSAPAFIEEIMKLPCVSISVDNDSLVITHQKEGRTDPLSVLIALQDLDQDGFDVAAKKIGSLTLQLLRKWYPSEFAQCDNLNDPPNPDV